MRLIKERKNGCKYFKYLFEKRKKWLDVLIGDRKLKKIEICYFLGIN